jgi:hypothetical protein
MSEQQASFRGWAKVEVMGHQSHVGYVTTEVFGQAVLFRIDQPAFEEIEETLTRAELIDDKYAQAGSVVKRGAIEGMTVLVGSASIYRIIPCDEATAMAAIRSGARRPLMVVKLVNDRQLVAAGSSEESGEIGDDDELDEDHTY